MGILASYRRRTAMKRAAKLLKLDRPTAPGWSLDDWQWALRQVGTPAALAIAERYRRLAERSDPMDIECPTCAAPRGVVCADCGPAHVFHMRRGLALDRNADPLFRKLANDIDGPPNEHGRVR